MWMSPSAHVEVSRQLLSCILLHVIQPLLVELLSYLGARSAAPGLSSGVVSHSIEGSQGGAQVARLAQQALFPAEPSYWPWF